MPRTSKKQDNIHTIVTHLSTEPSGNSKCSHESECEEEDIVAENVSDESEDDEYGDEESSVEIIESSEEYVQDFDETTTTQNADNVTDMHDQLAITEH